MKTLILTLVLSFMAFSLSAQHQYYKDNNIIKCRNTFYLCRIPYSSIKICEKEKMGKDYSDRLKNGQDAGISPLSQTCIIENNEKMYRTIKRIFNKYGFDIYNYGAEVGKDVTREEGIWNRISVLFSFNTETKKLERILFSFVDSDESKAKTVPIETYDELTRELTRTLRCIPNEIGEQLIYCTDYRCIVLK